ncbi:P-loop containing nucleoside triphosphate hydrolase protein [Lophiostoma macrostomum CBS 122681]|uniref:P-loop containing nucleoside triphosphate hydrolase protein n=1 Tax=Lophiostoma macrostomum CBS 122681 TaxID=1314788 RepID=A0A6A6TV07_9PLEO|nr:P-loop containing nucleoside triphosphate hydrolase protein [Lophiostoma macrostomum CBS 122681]
MKPFTDINGGDYHLKPLGLPHNYLYDDESPDQVLQNLGNASVFSVKTLCAAIQTKECTITVIKQYIQGYENSPSNKKIMHRDGWPALYYAVERNSPELVSYLLQNGFDPSEQHESFDVPLLAFAIIHGHRDAIDTTGITKVLLAFGISPKVIPEDMWIKFLDTPSESPPSKNILSGLFSAQKSESDWCEPALRCLLAKSLNLTHRYLLHLANKLRTPNSRQAQIAKANKMTELSKLPYYLIGQRPASSLVMNSVYAYVALGGKGPLVMAFAGASGHGKTEMARAIGDLLSVKTTVIDCASCTTVWGMLGPTSGWKDSERGSQLNNFLAENTGVRSVVFLDEFDKTKKEIRDALLVMTEKGEYQDRRNNVGVDCSKTIWIIATNLGTDKIAEYYTKHLEELSDKKRDRADMKPLQNILKRLYKNEFGAPFTGRINLYVPFLPFTSPECAVVLHKFALQFASEVREPIDFRPDINRLIGHCCLTFVDDGAVCTELTNTFYNKDLGARSLANAMKEIAQQFVTEYSSLDGLVTETINSDNLQEFIIRRFQVSDDAHEVGVFAKTKESAEGSEDEVDEDEE